MVVNIIAIVMTSLVFLVLAKLNDEKYSRKLIIAGIVTGFIWVFLILNLLDALINLIV